jgi:hypothetical protein
MYSTEGGSVTITSVSPPKGSTKWKVPLGDCKDVGQLGEAPVCGRGNKWRTLLACSSM